MFLGLFGKTETVIPPDAVVKVVPKELQLTGDFNWDYSAITLGTWGDTLRINSYLQAYQQVAEIQQCINGLSHFATRKGFKTDVEKLKGNGNNSTETEIKERIDEANMKVNMDQIIFLSIIKREIWGRCGWEIVNDTRGDFYGLKPLSSIYLKPIMDLNTLEIKSFRYDRPGISGQHILPVEDVLYFVRNPIDEKFMLGLSAIQAIIEATKLKVNLRRDLLESSKRLWAPLLVYFVDTSSEPTVELKTRKMDNFAKRLKPGQAIIHNTKDVTPEVINLQPNLQGLIRALEHADMEIFGNWQMPKSLFSREKCSVGSTQITDATTGKIITLDEWYNGCKPHSLFTLDDNLKITKTSDISVTPAGEKECMEITTRSGRKVEVSHDHPFLTVRGWKNADKLKMTDRIAIPRRIIYETEKEIPGCDITLMAAMVSEGYNRLKWHESIAAAEPKFRSFIIKAIEERDPEVKIRLDNREVCIHVNPSSFWRKLFKQYDLKIGLSDVKEIPDVIFGLSKKQRGEFLSILYEGDGSLYEYKGVWRMDYSSISTVLVNQVQHLLLTLGIQSFLVKQKTKYNGKECSPCWHVIINRPVEMLRFFNIIKVMKWKKNIPKAIEEVDSRNRSNDKSPAAMAPKEIWDILEEEKDSWKYGGNNYFNWCNLGATYKENRATTLIRIEKFNEKLKSDRIKNIIEADIYFDEIKRIERTGVQKVYDVSAPPFKNWLGNDIVVKNSLSKATLEYSLKALYSGPIESVQRYFKRELEAQFYSKLLLKWKYNTEKEKKFRVKHNWIPAAIYDPELINALSGAYDRGVISREDFFGLLGWEPEPNGHYKEEKPIPAVDPGKTDDPAEDAREDMDNEVKLIKSSAERIAIQSRSS